MAGNSRGADRPGQYEWVRGGGSLFAKNEKCAHGGWSQAGMGRVSGCLAGGKPSSAAMSGGTRPAERRASANYKHVIPLATLPNPGPPAALSPDVHRRSQACPRQYRSANLATRRDRRQIKEPSRASAVVNQGHGLTVCEKCICCRQIVVKNDDNIVK